MGWTGHRRSLITSRCVGRRVISFDFRCWMQYKWSTATAQMHLAVVEPMAAGQELLAHVCCYPLPGWIGIACLLVEKGVRVPGDLSEGVTNEEGQNSAYLASV